MIYTCSICGEGFRIRNACRRHEQECCPHTDLEFICGRQLYDEEGMAELSFMCPVCGLAFDTTAPVQEVICCLKPIWDRVEKMETTL